MSINYFRNLKKQQPIDNRPKYLRYGDVFISSTNNNRQQQYNNNRYNDSTITQDIPQQKFNTANLDRVRTTNRINSNNGDNIYPNSMDVNEQINKSQYQNIYNNNMRTSEDYDYYNNDIDYLQNNTKQNNNKCNQQMYNDDYYSNNSRVNYKKRQLPPLQQRYSAHNSQYDLQYYDKYWDDYDNYTSSKNNKKQEFKFLWQKFIITFTSVLSIFCIAWIAYHWNNNKSSNDNANKNTPEIIEPDKPSFKVLPDVPGGIEIPYKDKSIYDRVDPNFKQKQNERIRKLQEIPEDLPKVPNKQQVEEYAILEDKDYYVKCPINNGNAKAQIKAIKTKLSEFPDSDMLDGIDCSIRTVANTEGRRGKFILIGPFFDDNTAKQIGHFCKIKGEIISVKKPNKN